MLSTVFTFHELIICQNNFNIVLWLQRCSWSKVNIVIPCLFPFTWCNYNIICYNFPGFFISLYFLIKEKVGSSPLSACGVKLQLLLCMTGEGGLLPTAYTSAALLHASLYLVSFVKWKRLIVVNLCPCFFLE